MADLFCGAGGAARGLQQAGFRVVGFDIKPQPRYAGDEFHQQDALMVDLSRFDAVWASPPCQAYSTVSGRSRKAGSRDYPDLVEPVRRKLAATSLPYIIENVPGAPLEGAVLVCGSSFGLNVRRHRLFEFGHADAPLTLPCAHHWQKPRFRSLDSRSKTGMASVIGVHGHLNYRGDFELRCEAMDIDWMTNEELSQAIPPAYSKFLGEQLIKYVKVKP